MSAVAVYLAQALRTVGEDEARWARRAAVIRFQDLASFLLSVVRLPEAAKSEHSSVYEAPCVVYFMHDILN